MPDDQPFTLALARRKKSAPAKPKKPAPDNFTELEGTEQIDLDKLKNDDPDEWEKGFKLLQSTGLTQCSRHTETLCDREHGDIILEVVAKLRSNYVAKATHFMELNRLMAKMTKNALNDQHRKRKAVKRGGGRVDSLEAMNYGVYKDSDGNSSEDEVVAADRKEPDFIRPDDACEIGELALFLQFALNKIPQHYREVLQDVESGLKHREIAAKRGISIGSVGTYRARGLEAMLEFMPEKSNLM